MSGFSIMAEAFSALGKNKVRTSLSMLGIVIGVASVITMVAMGQGTKAKVEQEIAALGDDWMFVGTWGMVRAGVRTQQSETPPQQSTEDARALMRDLPHVIRAATPTNSMSLQIISSYSNYQTRVMGAWPSIFDIRRWRIERGRAYDEHDDAMQAKVCCIGQTTATELFGNIDPVGETIRINKVPFEIIGLLAAKGRSSEGRDYDDTILVPWNSFQRRLAGTERSETLMCATVPGVAMEQAKEAVRSLLRQRHRLGEDQPDDFRMFDLAESSNIKSEASAAFSNLLLVIASVSLLVGGVGIMNIMLVSVTERTREIGLRMALGADEFSVLAQFLIEAVLMCSIGGLIGLGVGVATAQVLSEKYEFPTMIPGWSLGVAVGFAVAVGIFFGFYPAWRASKLDPIEALRYE